MERQSVKRIQSLYRNSDRDRSSPSMREQQTRQEIITRFLCLIILELLKLPPLKVQYATSMIYRMGVFCATINIFCLGGGLSSHLMFTYYVIINRETLQAYKIATSKALLAFLVILNYTHTKHNERQSYLCEHAQYRIGDDHDGPI